MIDSRGKQIWRERSQTPALFDLLTIGMDQRGRAIQGWSLPEIEASLRQRCTYLGHKGDKTIAMTPIRGVGLNYGTCDGTLERCHG